jgi:8-oxo-dGTP pyrophosphatase MutT (NUDIX family)
VSETLQRPRPNRRHFLLGAGCSVIAPDDRILMLKQERYGAIEWSGPGGALEPDESVRECAVREAREEAGLSVELDRLIRISEFWDGGRMTGVGFLFLARPTPWPQEVHIPERDGITRFLDYRWCTREEAARLEGLWEHDVTRSAWPPEITVPLYDQLRTVAE